jgi:hypothetical protein
LVKIDMKKFASKALAAICFLVLVQGSLATDFSVGRVPLQMPGEGWRVIEVPDQGIDFSGGVTGTIRSETKAFIKQPAGKPFEAIVIVRASSAGMNNGYMSYTTDCTDLRGGYAQGNSGTRLSFSDCMRVHHQAPTQAVLKRFAPTVLDVLTTENVPSPKGLLAVMSRYASSNGTFVDVRVFFAPNFVGREGTAASAVPSGIVPQFVVWGQELAVAVKGSVTSMSGTLPFPPVEFTQ